jgi:Mrp family chromosome partitioning ATPase
MRRLREDMDDTLAALSRAVTAVPEPTGAPGPWRRYESLLLRRSEWEARLTALDVSIEALRDRVQKLSSELGASGSEALAAGRMAAEADALEAALEQAVRESTELQAEAELRAAAIDAASPVILKDRFGGPLLGAVAAGGRPALAAVACIAGAVAAAIAGAGLARLRSSRRGLRRLARRTSMPVLAAVPGPPHRPPEPAAWLADPPEAYANLYAQLSVVTFRGGPVRVALAEPGESAAAPYASARLAAAAANAGAATLLIDAAAPPYSLDAAAGAEAGTGFIDALHGQTGVGQAIRETATPRLHYLPRGGALSPEGPAPVLEQYAAVLAEAAEGYDAVICSTPGVLLRGEALRCVDALGTCLLVARGARTAGEPLLEARRLLVATGVTAPGLIAVGGRAGASAATAPARRERPGGAKAALW